MPLTKSRGQMYPWVTHMHTHISGQCPHQCSYCYVDNPRFGRPERFTGKLRLEEKELTVNYGKGRVIFIDHQNDLFSEAVPTMWIVKVMIHCCAYADNMYVFQTKNPARYLEEFKSFYFPPKTLLGTTIETNRNITGTKAPNPYARFAAMRRVRGHRTFLTIEPVMDFDTAVLIDWVDRLRPAFVNIGADSKGHGLPEPPWSKVRDLINGITELGVEIREKHNLARLEKKGG